MYIYVCMDICMYVCMYVLHKVTKHALQSFLVLVVLGSGDNGQIRIQFGQLDYGLVGGLHIVQG